jgi:hypothetical protein
MSKPIVLSQSQWETLRCRLARDYCHTPSIMLIRSKMKDVLGFTDRQHREWVPKMDGGYYDDTIRLDFYNEPKRTMFLLKYSEYFV